MFPCKLAIKKNCILSSKIPKFYQYFTVKKKKKSTQTVLYVLSCVTVIEMCYKKEDFFFVLYDGRVGVVQQRISCIGVLENFQWNFRSNHHRTGYIIGKVRNTAQ